MYEKGSPIRVNVNIGEAGLQELEFVGRVVIDGSDFMAIEFDTLIIPKVNIKSADSMPEDQPLEDVLGAEKEGANLERPEPPKVDNVRFLPLEPKERKQAPKPKPAQNPQQRRPKKK
jgi:hypothetical protein